MYYLVNALIYSNTSTSCSLRLLLVEKTITSKVDNGQCRVLRTKVTHIIFVFHKAGKVERSILMSMKKYIFAVICIKVFSYQQHSVVGHYGHYA